jgi:hypothetical protein
MNTEWPLGAKTIRRLLIRGAGSISPSAGHPAHDSAGTLQRHRRSVASRGFGQKGVTTMTKTSLLLCTSVAALSLATGAFAQTERMSPGAGGGAPAAKEMTPPSGAAGPRAAGGASERGTPPAARGDQLDRPEAQERSGKGETAGDTAKSEKAGRDGSGSTGASEGAAGRDAADAKGEKRSRDAADSKSMTKDGASTGASEGTAGTDKPSGSVAQLSGEKRTKVQSAFRLHRSEAVVKDIDIDVSVGVAVPRSVSLYAVPEEVVLIVPEYRRYKYFIFGDKVVIVDPGTYEIVDVLILA